MKHIIALPYWCENEIKNFLQVLRRWDLFCVTDVPYSFLIVKRFDAPPHDELLETCSALAPTDVISCDKYPWTGWPAGCNGMFKQTMEHVLEHETKDGGFLFWFEHDVIPIYSTWLTWLHKTWQPDLAFMGQYISPPWINLHRAPMPPSITGTALFGKNLAANPAFQQIVQNVPLDYTLSEALPKNGAKIAPMALLFDLWFFMPDWVARCDLTKLMINGIKEYHQREKVIGYILKNRDE